MNYNKKEQLLDKINGLRITSTNASDTLYNRGVVDAFRRTNEIFEGDILGIDTGTDIVYVNVYWDSNHALFMLKSEEYNGEEALAEIFEDYTYPIMVVGNIWEEEE